MKDYCKILNEIIKVYYDNAYPEYFEDDVCKIFEREGITEGYKAEPKHGRWVMEQVSEDKYGNKRFYYFCTECGAAAYEFSQPYCHRCGARMDEVEDDNR